MKKACPICNKTFLGRSDKIFCSSSCKNIFHNSRRKEGIIELVHHALLQNRAILYQLLPLNSESEIVERVVLQRLGFHFERITGVQCLTDSRMKKQVYEFVWEDLTPDKILVERNPEQLDPSN